jgi:hypothetical protein
VRPILIVVLLLPPSHSAYARCVDDSLLLLLNWEDDIPSQMDLTTVERYHLRESLIRLLKVSLQCTQLALDCHSLSSSSFPACRDAVVSVSFYPDLPRPQCALSLSVSLSGQVLFHSILHFVPWLQNEVFLQALFLLTFTPQELFRFETKEIAIENIWHPLSIDTILETDLESNFIPSAFNYLPKIPNPHQREFVIIKSLSELMDPTALLPSSPPLSPHPSSSHIPTTDQRLVERSDTVKQFATLLLQIFQQCEALPLLNSLQVTPTHHPLDHHPLSAAFVSSPHTILLSICDPTFTTGCSSGSRDLNEMKCSQPLLSALYSDHTHRTYEGRGEEEEDEI